MDKNNKKVGLIQKCPIRSAMEERPTIVYMTYFGVDIAVHDDPGVHIFGGTARACIAVGNIFITNRSPRPGWQSNTSCVYTFRCSAALRPPRDSDYRVPDHRGKDCFTRRRGHSRNCPLPSHRRPPKSKIRSKLSLLMLLLLLLLSEIASWLGSRDDVNYARNFARCNGHATRTRRGIQLVLWFLMYSFIIGRCNIKNIRVVIITVERKNEL